MEDTRPFENERGTEGLVAKTQRAAVAVAVALSRVRQAQ